MSERKLVLLLACIGLLSGVIGGGIAYLGERQGSKDARVHEELQNRLRIRGIARVYKENLQGAASALENDESNGDWPSQDENVLFELPSIEDRSLIAAELSGHEFVLVTQADTAIHDAVAVAYERGNELTLSNSDREYLQAYIRSLKKGATALAALAGESTH